MTDEEDDYMSDKFLVGLQDIRPSLINNRAKKRQIDVEARHNECIKKQKDTKKQISGVLDNERLQEVLSKPLSPENKGYKLLEKMGYKAGEALGKPIGNEQSSSKESRLIVPIGIVLKTDRQGLGREAALRELNEKRHLIRKQRLERELGRHVNVEDFRRRTNQKHEEKFILNSLKRCQQTCENLDMQSNIETPELPWFWPERLQEKSEEDCEELEDQNEEVEDEEFSSQEKLEMLTNYIRTSYLFCYWCGIRYNDAKDLKDNCPGLTKDEH